MNRWQDWRAWPWWLIGIVLIVVSAAMMVMRPPSQAPWNTIYRLCVPIALVLTLLSGWIYLFVIPHELPKARRRRGECHACGYTLSTGMHTCPECGQQRRV